MSVRQTHIIYDLVECFYQLFSKLKTESRPWNSWTVEKKWPEQEMFTDKSAFLIIGEPIRVGSIDMHGGMGKAQWEMDVGMWITRKSGGDAEIKYMASALHSFFNNPNDCNTKQFTVSLGGTAYTDKTLLQMGIHINGIAGPENIPTEDLKEFRKQVTLNYNA